MTSIAITSPVLIVKPDDFCCRICLGDVLEFVLDPLCGTIGAVFHGEGLAEEVVFPEKACGVEAGVGVYGLDGCGFCDVVVTTVSAAPCCTEPLPIEGMISDVRIPLPLFGSAIRDIPQFGQNVAFAISVALH